MAIPDPRRENKEVKPNIIWVFGDQHRAQAMGYAGDPNVHTPNIDRMATEGVIFENAVGGAPLCCPFRGALLSGRYPHNSVPGHEVPLPDGMPTIAQPFNDAGYETAYFGKWHIDGFEERNGRGAFHTVPADRRGGFNTWIGYENNNSQFDCWVHGHDAEGKEVSHYQLPAYETDALTDMTIDFVNKREAGDAPYFCVLSVQPPHGPYIAPEEWMRVHTPGEIVLRENVPPIPEVEKLARKHLAGYYAMIENLDWNFGRLREALEVTGQWENTYVFFFSDHGDMMGSHGHLNKTSPYEESLRVPCVVGGGIPFYGSGGGVASCTLSYPFNHVDYGPTSLGLCGLDVPEYMEGTDFTPAMKNPKGDYPDLPDSAYVGIPISPRHGTSIDRPWRGVVTKDGWKYACFEGQPWMMHDLNTDPYELRNLCFYGRYHAKQEELQAELASWIEKTGDSFELPTI